MPSTSDSRQPYRLSNFDLVTESFTLNAGNGRRPSFSIWYRRCTPVVVSSVTPLMCARRVESGGSASRCCAIDLYSATSSSLVGFAITERSFSAFAPRISSSVASPPSSRIMFANSPFGHSKMRCENSQYSSSDSPLNANTGVPASTIAAAAWSCVEKMLHEAQRTSAPSAFSVSISTPVWIVMCSEPAMRAPFSGCCALYSSRICTRPGISVSAMFSSLRPQPASAMSATT